MKMTTSPEIKCIFCKIARGQDDKTNILYENEELVIFKDIKPATRHHYLIIPKQHIKDPKNLNYSHLPLVERLVEAATDFLKQQNAAVDEARLGFHWPPFNSISHLHLHAISCTSEMGFIARGIFRPNTLWFVTNRFRFETQRDYLVGYFAMQDIIPDEESPNGIMAEWLVRRLKAMDTKS